MRTLVFSVLVAAIVLVQPAFEQPQPAHVATGPAAGAVPDGLDALPPDARDVSGMLRGLQGFFTENLGQVDNPEVRFYAEGAGLSVGLTRDGLILTMRDGRANDGISEEDGPSRMFVLRLSFVGHRSVEPVGFGVASQLTNTFIGNDPSKWVRGARSFTEIVYEGLYPGIDLRFHFKDGRLKYDFILAAEADPGSVLMRYEGTSGLRVDPRSGDMLVSTPMGVLRDERPIIMWEESGDARSCPGDFALGGDGSWRFASLEGVPRGVPMIIDPGLVWSTYLGGSGLDILYSLALDDDGSVYAVGRTDSINYPTTPGAYDRSQNDYKGFVTKLDPTGSTVLFSTFFGGTNSTVPGGITATQSAGMTPEGNLALASVMYCDDCPTTPDAIDATHNGRADIYFLVLTPQGDELVYASYFGGSDRDVPHDLVIDDYGAVVIVGETVSPDWAPPPNTYCATYNGVNDVFVLKLDSSYHQILGMTYLGGSSLDVTYQVDVDPFQNIVVTGGTQSSDYPTTEGAYCRTYAGNMDSFLTKLEPNCTSLIFSTLYGGSDQDDGCRLRVCPDGRIWVGAETRSPDYPTTPDAQYSHYTGGFDPGISVFDSTGSKLLHSTFFPGTTYESCFGVALNEGTGEIFFYTETGSAQLPTTKGCYCSALAGSSDMLIIGFNLTTYRFDYCTYIGGSGPDSTYLSWGDTLMIDGEGMLYLAGTTASWDFPTTGQAAYRAYAGGSYDGLVLKLDPRPITERPDKPTGLEAKSSNNFVEVSWDPPSVENYKIHQYQLYRSLKDNIGPDATKWTVTKGIAFQDRWAQNGRTYYYWVSAFNSVGESALAGPVVGRPMGPPSAPRDLLGTSGNGSITLTWSPPENMNGGPLLGYQVMRGGRYSDLARWCTIGPDLQLVDADVELGKTYFYALKAFNEIYPGEQSSVVGVIARDVPTSPLRATLEPLDRGALITWDPPSSDGGARLLGYYILRGPSNETMEIVGVMAPSQRSFPDYGLTNGVEYIYRVAAFSEVGMGRLSEMLVVKPIGTPSEPLMLAAERGDGRVSLTWKPPSNDGGWPVTAYKVYAGREKLVEIESSWTSTSYMHTGLKNGELWYYAVLAMNKVGPGPMSDIVFAVPLGLSEAPASFIAEAMGSKVRLSWYTPFDTGGAPVDEYRIYRAAEGSPFDILDTVVPTLLTIWDLEVVDGREYDYCIAAVTEMGEGERSAMERAIPYGPPGAPIGLRAEAGDRKVTLHWSAPESDGGREVEGYCIYRGATADAMQMLLRVAPQRMYVDIGGELTNGRMYFYCVAALNGAGEGPGAEPVPASPVGIPGAPLDLHVRFEKGAVIVSWAPPIADGGRPIIGYVVLRGRSVDGLAAYRTIGTTQSYIDRDVEPGDSYYYSVRAVSAEGEGDHPVPKLIEVPLRPAESWVAGASPPWSAIVVVLVVMIAVVLVTLIRRRHTGHSDGQRRPGGPPADCRGKDVGRGGVGR